ncbi:FAD-dependent oxidoreductase [Sphingomonas sp. MA1305]|uniref:FAD/NAD(P)-binding protein n=1 Tax=Sphingomonas sp. MA1305 TaxID=2479204 RepID=UPI0018E04175|nr:FAD/NAD(P)-binding protein [Sphingomonas sp. MA1305]MBI0473860.1 FAD-dependent oxidoreductase [Sphingomonas sp. MA1305]
MIRHVAIVGAGFSGTLQAINLLRHDGPRATLIERAPVAGLGVAYGAAQPSHLLNVRAGNMSAFPDDPDHFVRWLGGRGMVDAAGTFVPRVTYGAYLRDLLEEARARAGDRLTVVQNDVADIVAADEGASVMLADGERIAADAAVLAVGNLPPHDPPGLDPATLSTRYRNDPWAPGLSDGLSDADTVLVIGTGLTMVDVALTLDAQGFGGRIVAVSRRGLLPREHAPPAPNPDRLRERPATVASALVAMVRDRGERIGWRQAVDELRPFTQGMWANASGAERARFLRHLRPWWDVHRHRIAPPVAARLAAMIADGRLHLVAGKTAGFVERPDGVAVTWRPRGSDATEIIVAQRIVNCTGPQGDLARTTEPLLRRLADRGTIRADAARLGIDVDAEARTIAADGAANDWLYALGPMTRGAFWEIVAVPDIRTQTWAVARKLSNAHWVGGEGL